jgi:tetratricopeptide (TPR) repeat protein
MSTIRPPRRYRAFVSYSHRDKAIGEKLFRLLDSYRPPKQLVGRETPTGLVPPKLHPVFRDREELATAHDLSDRIRDALERSDALVVVCTPQSAQSRWVNREIETFVSLGKGDRIHAIVAEGEPPGCFPPAMSQIGAETLAADLRKGADGWSTAPLKLIAGLLGLEFGELQDRELRRERARTRRNFALLVGFAALALAASGSAYAAWQNAQARELMLEQAIDLTAGVVDQAVQMRDYVPRQMVTGLLSQADSGFRSLLENETGSAKLQHQYGRLLIEFSRHYAALGDTTKQLQSAEAAVDVLTRLAARHRDEAAYSELASVSITELGRAWRNQGRLTEAEAAYIYAREVLDSPEEALGSADWRSILQARALSLSPAPEEDSAQSRSAQLQQLIAARARGGAVVLAAVGDNTRQIVVSERSEYARTAPTRGISMLPVDNSDPERIAVTNLVALGDILSDQRRIDEARRAYLDALSMIDRNLSRAPASSEARADRIVVTVKLGDLDRETDRLAEASRRYAEALEHSRQLSRDDPSNREWRTYIGVATARSGMTAFARGDLDGALAHFRSSRDLYQALIDQDEANASWKRDLATTLGLIGDVEAVRGDYRTAGQNYAQSHAIIAGLAQRDPNNMVWQRDLAFSHMRQGELSELLEEPVTASLQHYRRALSTLNHRRDGGEDTRWTRQRRTVLNRIEALEQGQIPQESQNSSAIYGHSREAGPSVTMEICQEAPNSCGATVVEVGDAITVRIISPAPGNLTVMEVDSAGNQDRVFPLRGDQMLAAGVAMDINGIAQPPTGRFRLVAIVQTEENSSIIGQVEYEIRE